MPKEEKITIYTDGGSRGNPGPAGVGVVISMENNLTPRRSSGQVKKYSKEIGARTNNEAEYEAVIFGLQKAKQLFGKEKAKKMEIEIRMDSELVCRQLRGEYKIMEEKLFPLFIKIWNLRLDFGKLVFKEIPREKNKEADRLVNEALDKKEQQSIF